MVWSADSRALAFFAAGTLKRVSVAGGSPQSLFALGPTEFTAGASWNRAGVLLFPKGSADRQTRDLLARLHGRHTDSRHHARCVTD